MHFPAGAVGTCEAGRRAAPAGSWGLNRHPGAEHRGKRVYGKARHRDPVRPSHSYTAHRYGHRWVVLAALVRSPFAVRPWAPPVLVALYRSPGDDRARGRPRKAPAELMALL